MRLTHGVQPWINLLLDVPLFDHVLHDEVSLVEQAVVGGVRDARQNLIQALLAWRFVQHTRQAQVLAQLCLCLLEYLVRYIHENNAVARLDQILGNTHAHDTGTDHTNTLQLGHSSTPSRRFFQIGKQRLNLLWRELFGALDQARNLARVF